MPMSIFCSRVRLSSWSSVNIDYTSSRSALVLLPQICEDCSSDLTGNCIDQQCKEAVEGYSGFSLVITVALISPSVSASLDWSLIIEIRRMYLFLLKSISTDCRRSWYAPVEYEAASSSTSFRLSQLMMELFTRVFDLALKLLYFPIANESLFLV